MGKHGTNGSNKQRDGNLIKNKVSAKRKKDSPAAIDKTDKKTKHSDSESTTSENWLDIYLPCDLDSDKTIEMTENLSQSILMQDNITMLPGNVAAMSTPGPINTPQMIFPQQMYGMPSPIIQQHQQSLSLSDSDAIRIATLIKEMIRQDISDMVKQQVSDQTSTLMKEITALKQENTSLKEDISAIRLQQDELEQYSRRTCIRIGNIREHDGESTDSIVLNVSKESGADISASDIDRSHRVGKHKPGKHREIIVKFVNYKARTRFIKSRKTLRERNCAIYLNEDLTNTRKNLDYQCRKLKKDKNSVIQSSWTVDGRQFIKTDKDTTVRIEKLSDLKPFGWVDVSTNKPSDNPSDNDGAE